ncbi:MAG: hypothetical protein HC910_22560 [Spirulinaceae cyanobacterium SM2_1_0]|nr:hypothetical protein [Spirulinaceae cyanobacterium SM2_1_0]
MKTLQKLSDDLTELEQQILELMDEADPDSNQLAELESQAQWVKNKLKVYFSLQAAFDALPENGAGEVYGDLLDQMADVKAAICRRVSSRKLFNSSKCQQSYGAGVVDEC